MEQAFWIMFLYLLDVLKTFNIYKTCVQISLDSDWLGSSSQKPSRRCSHLSLVAVNIFILWGLSLIIARVQLGGCFTIFSNLTCWL